MRTYSSRAANVAIAGFVLLLTGNAVAGEPQKDDVEAGFTPLFNGKDFTGWEGDFDLWKVQDEMIVGDSPGIEQNQFLATKKSYGDFELRLEFRLHGGKGNSGVQFRSKREAGSTAVIGFQADIGQNYWGALYDEHRRNKVLARPAPELDKVFKKDGWNSYAIRAEGNRIVLKVNGETTVDYIEEDEAIARRGVIALQVHSGPAMRIDFRKIRLRELDKP